jgi:hypothetical protein
MVSLTLLLLLTLFLMPSTAMLQHAHDMHGPIYAQTVIETNGQNLLTDAHFAYVNGNVDHADIMKEVDCARRMLKLVQQSQTDPANHA